MRFKFVYIFLTLQIEISRLSALSGRGIGRKTLKVLCGYSISIICIYCIFRMFGHIIIKNQFKMIRERSERENMDEIQRLGHTKSQVRVPVSQQIPRYSPSGNFLCRRAPNLLCVYGSFHLQLIISLTNTIFSTTITTLQIKQQILFSPSHDMLCFTNIFFPLNTLGLYLYTLVIGHKSCNMLSILNKLTL